jgi:hypothetical protein
MTGEELALLKRVDEGHTLLTEYATEDEWNVARALKRQGLLDAVGVITGTVRLKLTDAGRAAIT